MAEVLRQPAIDAGTFDKRRDLDVWPYPENVGIELDRDDGLLVRAVEPGSPAAKAGLAAGDRLGAAGGRRLFGQADLRGVLQRGPRGAGRVELVWTRGGELGRGALELTPGWRATPLAWRMSVSQGNVGAPPGFAWPNRASDADRRRLALPAGTMAVRPWFGGEGGWPAQAAGLSADDVITAVDGTSPDLAGREFLTWFRLGHEPGDRVVLGVRDARGRAREVSYALSGAER